MSKTPRTDTIIKEYKDSPWLIAAQLALLASELEQQLNDVMAERDGWKEAAYSLGEAIPASWEELQPPAEQLRKFKEMVALQNKKTEKLLDNADKPEPRIWDVWLHMAGKEIQSNPDKWHGPNEWKQIKVQEVQLLDNADKHSKMYP
jgi:hypothetical protein